MVLKLVDLIQTYDNALSESVCDFLVNTFESNKSKQERIEDNKSPNFTHYNLTENISDSEDLSKVHDYLISELINYRDLYYEYTDSRCFPKDHNYEEFRIKKYMNDGNDVFNTHVDVYDYTTARRFLSFLWYLNDVGDGGKTIFRDIEIKPSKGKLVIFPCLWMFPHKGDFPISNPKYILTTYLHYK